MSQNQWNGLSDAMPGMQPLPPNWAAVIGVAHDQDKVARQEAVGFSYEDMCDFAELRAKSRDDERATQLKSQFMWGVALGCACTFAGIGIALALYAGVSGLAGA